MQLNIVTFTLCQKIRTMSTAELKTNIESLIHRINDKEVLQAYFTILKNMVKEDDGTPIGYSITGQAISKKNLVDKVLGASQRVKSGKFISQEDLDREVDNW